MAIPNKPMTNSFVKHASWGKRAWWRFLRLIGQRKRSWDLQHGAGIWIRSVRSPHTIRLAEELCQGGVLLEFGCGDGTLPLVLKSGSFSRYYGSDISEIAVKKASDAARTASLTNCQFEQCDMAKWTGASGVSLIVAEECLNYLPLSALEAFVQRCCDSLTPEGSMLTVFHSAEKHAATLEICRKVGRVKNELRIDTRTYLILGANPPTSDEHSQNLVA